MLIQVPENIKLRVKSVLTGFRICQEYLPQVFTCFVAVLNLKKRAFFFHFGWLFVLSLTK